MRHTVWTIAVLSAALGISVGPEPARGEIEVGGVIDAIQRDYCLDEYWGYPGPPQAPTRLPVAVRVEGDTAYVWVEGLRARPGVQRWAEFYAIASKDGKAAVAYTFGYNVETMQDNFDFKAKYDRVFGGGFKLAELLVPSECVVHFEPDTPLKLRMLDVIQRSVENQLTQFNKYAGANYPDRVSIVIGNFNPDHSDTYVVVRETGEVLNVVLHGGTDPFSSEYLEKGEYPSVPINADYAISWLRERVAPIGIERVIQVGR
jgi:hypothetical protein